MKISQLAVQLYTLRSQCTSEATLGQSLHRLREIGYRAVETISFDGISARDVARLVADAGLTICSVHQPSVLLFSDPDRCIETVRTLGASVCVYPSPRDVDLASETSVQAWVQRLAATGRRFREAGLTLAYHNHAVEFTKAGGVTLLERIYRDIAPDEIASELDTYWIQFGGGNPVDWIRTLRGRMPTIHLKDYGFSTANVPHFAEIGSGNLPMRTIIAEAEAGGCPWFIVEQDTCPGDPFASLCQSFQYLQTLATR